MIYLIVALILFGLILTWKPYVKPNVVLPSKHTESTNTTNSSPTIGSNQAYLEERIKPDKYIAGVWGVESNQINLRSPYHIASYKRAELLQKVFQEARTSTDDSEFEDITQKLQKVEEDYHIDHSVLTKNQDTMLQSITDGQGVPTRVAGDSLEDERMSVKEVQTVFPMFGISSERPDFLSFKKYSIQTKPGSVETLMEKNTELIMKKTL